MRVHSKPYEDICSCTRFFIQCINMMDGVLIFHFACARLSTGIASFEQTHSR